MTKVVPFFADQSVSTVAPAVNSNSNPNVMDYDASQNESYSIQFVAGFVISQILGIICIILVWIWTGKYMGGFSGPSELGLNFNYHPVFMVMGLVFLYGDAILVYRVLKNTAKLRLKLIHGVLHTLAFSLAVTALKAVFDSHNLAKTPIPNVYSLHSWIGLTTVILFSMQFVFGFVTFLLPGLSRPLRASYLPLHVFFGLAIFVMAIAACVTGISEKILWADFGGGGSYAKRSPPSYLVNFLGLCLVAFGVLVVYLVAMPQFKRKPLPEESALNMDISN